MHYQVLAKRVRYFKEKKEGVEHMCRELEKIAEQIAEQKRVEGRMELVLTFAEVQSCSVEEAMERLRLPEDERIVIREKLGKESTNNN